MSTDDREAELRRLASLETVVRALRAEVAELRARVEGGAVPRAAEPLPHLPPTAPSPGTVGAKDETRSTAGSPAQGASPSPELPPLAPRPPRADAPRRSRPLDSGLDFEKLVGRYGTLAVAALAILLGVGAFLQWAISRELLGPQARVALGGVAALVIAGVGLRLRSRGSKRFGDVLLALALAVVHVVAWAAGPSLGIIPSAAALGIAAVASIALAALALREQHETLFAIGMGGALIAPFVTSDGGGDVAALLTYGWVVSTAAIAALRQPEWGLSRRLLGIFAAGYAGAAIAGMPSSASDTLELAPAIMLIGLAVSTILLAEREGRRALGRSYLALAAIFLGAAAIDASNEWSPLSYGIIGTLTLYALRRRAPNEPDEEGWGSAFDAVLVPLAFMAASLLPWIDSMSADASRIAAVKVAAVWVAFGVVATFTSARVQRGLHLALALTAITFVILLAPDNNVRDVAALAAVAAAASVLLRDERRTILLLPLGIGLLASSLIAYGLLDDRLRYEYTPFVSIASLTALLATMGWLAASFIATRGVAKSESLAVGSAAEALEGPMRVAGPLVAFLWVREELVYAFSADIAVFLLISYYAILGVVLIGVGRSKSIAALRHVGLALALYAGLKAGAQASDIDAIGWRVGSYLIVGAFLLGVGYWYRARDTDVEQGS